MKIHPTKRANLPKYAAALAAVAAAGLLTGCHTSGEVVTEGTAPVPVDSDAGQLTGQDSGKTDASCTVAEGDTIDDEAVQLAGDVAMPYFQEDEAYDKGLDWQMAFVDGFARHGIPLVPDSEPLYLAGSAETVWKSVNPPLVRIAFFDGSAEDMGYVCRDWILSSYTPDIMHEYDWGFVQMYEVSAGEVYASALVDVSLYDTMTAEQAAQIAEDLLNESDAASD